RAIAVLQVVPRDSLPQLGSMRGVAGDVRFGKGSGGECDSPIELSGTPEVLRGGGQHVPAGTSRPLGRVGNASPVFEYPFQILTSFVKGVYPLSLLGRSQIRHEGSLQIAGH